jgi:hypothetical protein
VHFLTIFPVWAQKEVAAANRIRAVFFLIKKKREAHRKSQMRVFLRKRIWCLLDLSPQSSSIAKNICFEKQRTRKELTPYSSHLVQADEDASKTSPQAACAPSIDTIFPLQLSQKKSSPGRQPVRSG